MQSILFSNKKIHLEFTDDRLTDQGGLIFLLEAAKRLGLFRLLSLFLSCKRRRRGASDMENLWSLVASLACGDGTLQDQDRLKGNRANRELLELTQVAGSRRMGEWLGKLRSRHVDSLRGIATALAKRVIPTIIKAELKARKYVPIFLDGTAIEVQGKNFVGARKIYSGDKALWLYAAFVGKMQVSSRLCAAVSDAVGDWYTQLKRDVVRLIPQGVPVWVTVDNAYFRKDFVAYLAKLGWDFSMSVTDDQVKRRILAKVDLDGYWTPLRRDETADTREVMYQPQGWARAYRCVVVRRFVETEDERELFPTYTVIMTSNNQLHREIVVHRHRCKQGFENGFKGPLREMDLHHPPTASLVGNQVFYLCGLLAHILLTYLQYGLLPEDARKVGLRPLMRDLMRSLAKVTRSGRQLYLKFSKDHYRFDWLVAAMNQLEAWRHESPA